MSETSEPGVMTLRQARERAGVHLGALAATLKVPVRRLEALESGRYDELPDMTFARALALSVCRTLKVDPQPILATFPASHQVRLEDIERTLNQPLPQRSMPLSAGDASLINPRVPVPIVVAALIAVVAAVLWFVLPQTVEPVATETPASVVAPLPEPSAAVGGPPAVEAVPAPEATTAPAEPVPVVVAPEPIGAAVSAAVNPNGALLLRARQPTWVQVTGASGNVLLQRSMQPGESVSFDADLPLAVVVGRADEVDVSVRGQVFDLAPHTRNNVARFEVR